MPKLNNELNSKVRNLVNGLRNCHPGHYMMLRVIKEDSRNRGHFLSFLVRRQPANLSPAAATLTSPPLLFSSIARMHRIPQYPWLLGCINCLRASNYVHYLLTSNHLPNYIVGCMACHWCLRMS